MLWQLARRCLLICNAGDLTEMLKSKSINTLNPLGVSVLQTLHDMQGTVGFCWHSGTCHACH